MYKFVSLCLVVVSVIIVGCSNDFSGDKYTSANAGETQKTVRGTVLSLRKVEINPDGVGSLGAGALLGGVGGGLLGSAFGKGGGKILTTAAGAISGAVAGNAIQNRAQEGIEYTVKLESGEVITLAQGLTPMISVGQQVFVVNSEKGRSRIVPE
ncbi:MAG: glycine zipper 2TM domain-containing protein [Holosporales bacterium]|jgi:outer membrane lipoprotein SlyB|nr:glycine zipper 2TM domain-containing protein [Holosporales bacterium]